MKQMTFQEMSCIVSESKFDPFIRGFKYKHPINPKLSIKHLNRRSDQRNKAASRVFKSVKDRFRHTQGEEARINFDLGSSAISKQRNLDADMYDRFNP